ncbi:hypothetical protein [Clostridium guangxiense]|uniref:hypothetical protein n=1 Tax=Clostridium guangxiense TaxID=1662055 RepID=UPI001E5B34F8|nr:hypothetical protein [Clostridium guangxiense]MCD2347217.1 hypothetical protein [Clostridium guangxiense]
MEKKLKETIKTAKNLHKKGFIYLKDNVELDAEPNYQILALIIEKLNLYMDKNKYELIKYDKDELIHELALLNFSQNDLIDNIDVEFMENVIKEYADIVEPVVIDDICVFTIKMCKLKEIYEKSILQIEEGKFKNIMF